MIDIHNDDNLEILTKISQEEGLPDFVKQADVSLMASPSELPKEAFAIESKRLYPMFDKASTWLSSRYFTKSAKGIPEPTRTAVGNKLKKACSAFGITWPKEKAKEVVKLAESDYALVDEHNGRKILRYPINTKENVEASIYKFSSEYALYPPDWRKKAAERLLEKAGEYGIKFGPKDSVSKYACRTKSLETIKTAMKLRSRYTTSDEFSQLYRDIIEKSAQEDPETLVSAIDILDRSSGLARYWDHGISDPYLSVYKQAEEEKVPEKDVLVEDVVLESGEDKEEEGSKEEPENEDGDDVDVEESEGKSAETSGRTITLADRPISIDQLAGMPLEWYSDILGDDVAKEIADGNEIDEEKLKIILASLPRPSQLLIVNNLPN